jgi:hypothetical protein
VLANQAEDRRRLKARVLDSVSSPITRRVYNLGLDEFIQWFGLGPRPGFTKATVNAWGALEARGSGPFRSTHVSPLSASWRSRRLTTAAGTGFGGWYQSREGAKSKGVRVGNWLSLRRFTRRKTGPSEKPAAEVQAWIAPLTQVGTFRSGRREVKIARKRAFLNGLSLGVWLGL